MRQIGLYPIGRDAVSRTICLILLQKSACMGARNDAIIIDNHALYRQNWLLSDRCTFVGVIKGIFITVDSHGIGKI